MPNDILLFQM